MPDARPPQPKHALHRVQRMAATPGCAVVHWTRAIAPTAARLDCSGVEAERYVLRTITVLDHADFVGAVQQRGTWFDIYACYRDGLGWYVKVGEDDDGAVIISHHEPEHGPVTTVTGERIHPTRPRHGDIR